MSKFKIILDFCNWLREFKIILDFCNWLREQGAEYETINYGDDADIAEMLNEYLKEEGD